jgi:Cof subfamily protein (haloacid dehalogenase superfamily)
MDNSRGLFLADVDGTLVTPEKVITRKALEAISNLGQSGLTFSIVSGRPPRGMKQLIETLNLDVPCAAFNGAAIIRPDLSVVKKHLLTQETVQKAVKIIEDAKIDYWIYHDLDWYIRDPKAHHVAKEQQTVQFAPRVVDRFDDLISDTFKDGVYKIVAVCDDQELLDQCQAKLQKELDGQLRAAHSQSYYVDITHPDATKGTVVEELCELLKIPSHNVTTIGDMNNDILMFEKSRFSIAMGNANDDVKKATDHTTDSNTHEGFAHAVDYFLKEIFNADSQAIKTA